MYYEKTIAKRFYPNRINDRCSDYWYFSGGGIAGVSNYTVRARVVEGLSLASAAKVAVAENAASGTAFATGWTAPTATASVASVGIGATGVITVTYTAAAGGGTILVAPAPVLVSGVIPATNLTWSCNGGTLADRFKPANCR